MTEAKYKYAKDENGKVICINDITQGNRYSHKYRCLGCLHEMIPNLGQKKIHYFSHKANTTCNGETKTCLFHQAFSPKSHNFMVEYP